MNDQSDNGYDDGYAMTGEENLSSGFYVSEVGAYAESVSAYGTFDQTGNVNEWTEGLLSIQTSPASEFLAGARGEMAPVLFYSDSTTARAGKMS